MPLLQKIEENDCQIAIWDMSESLDSLIRSSISLELSKFKTEKRKKEFLASRLLLNELLPNASISYNKYGAPEIGNNHFISISHSKNLAAIIISKNKVGLDIEIISGKPLRLASKFISKDSHNPLSKEKATLIWCCKEAVFKWHQKGSVDFIADIKIKPFIIKEKGQLIATFKIQNLSLHYKKIENHFLVYVCKRK
jgi:4'-phosphopantetheinyl transferase